MSILRVEDRLVKVYVVKCDKCGEVDEQVGAYPSMWLCRKCSQLNFEF